jgi:hypothetical protein
MDTSPLYTVMLRQHSLLVDMREVETLRSGLRRRDATVTVSAIAPDRRAVTVEIVLSDVKGIIEHEMTRPYANVIPLRSFALA